MLRLLPLSDLHFEFHRDGGKCLVESLLDPSKVDVCLLAGDIAVGDGIEEALYLFCKRYNQVVYVMGNHEYYGITKQGAEKWTKRAVRKHHNLTWLNAEVSVVLGQRFVGATLWFSKKTEWWSYMNDFHTIRDFEKWVYKENTKALKLFSEVRSKDVVITHHLPTPRSVAKNFEGNRLNPYFVCDVGDEVLTKPKLWIHGHTHNSFDYQLGDCRVVCNPFGYVRGGENKEFDPYKTIDVR